MKDDSRQLELVKGEIVERTTHLTDAELAQRKAAARAREENRRRMGMINKVAEISLHANRKDPESLLACFQEYLRVAEEEGAMIGNLTAYAAMGITRQTADEWLHGKSNKSDPRYRDLIYYVKNVCASYREYLGLEGKIHPALTIFWQRNFDGLTNEDIVRVEQTDLLGEVKSSQEIKDKYADLAED